MTKDEFLNRKEIIGFINFIVLRIYNDDLFNHSYLLKKRENVINTIILYNPLNGEVNSFDISDFNLIMIKR